VGPHGVPGPLDRVAVAAAPAGGAADHVAGADGGAVDLEQPPLVRAARVDDHLGADRVLATEQAPRGLARPLEPHRHRAVAQRLLLAHQPVAAAPPAGATRVGADAVGVDAPRIAGLEHLDRDVLQRAVDVVDQRALAVGARPRAPAADRGLQAHPLPPDARV